MSESMKFDNFVDYHYHFWKEKYVIPFEDEFNVQLLLQLRYDILRTKPEHTKTKLELIEMANMIQSKLKIKEKDRATKIMYINTFSSDRVKIDKIIVYSEDKMYIIQNSSFSIADYIDQVIKLFKGNEMITAYVDTNGFGQGIYDELYSKGFDVRKLKLRKHPMF